MDDSLSKNIICLIGLFSQEEDTGKSLKLKRISSGAEQNWWRMVKALPKQKACDDFLEDKPEKIEMLQIGIGLMIKNDK